MPNDAYLATQRATHYRVSRQDIDAIAPLIIAAKLRQLVDEFDEESKKHQGAICDGLWEAEKILQNHSIKLDPQGWTDD
jgi:hypothetical protein